MSLELTSNEMLRQIHNRFTLRIGQNARRALAIAAISAVVTALPAQMVKAPRYAGANTPEEPVRQLNLPPLPNAITPHGTVVEDVVVRINDQIISRSDVERSAEQLQQEAAQTQIPPAELAIRQRDMLRDMIDQQLLLSKAKELGLNADAEVIRRLDEIRKQNKLESLEDLEKAARAQGVSFEDFKAQIRNGILSQEVVRDEVGRRLQMTQAEETAYYEAHKQDFIQPEQIRLSEILVPLSDTASANEIRVAEDKANKLKTDVMQGKAFDQVAKQSSGGPTAAQGGELGLFKRGALAKVLEDQTFSLKTGESTQPIRTRQGFVILKVTDHVAAGTSAMKEVEPQIQEALYIQAMQPALRTYLSKLRQEAYVDLQPGFVDTGSSGKETKPIFTSYAPPPPKKKKKAKQTVRFDRRSGQYTTAPLKQTVVSSPDTTGGRTITGAAEKPAVDAGTGLAVLPATTLAKGEKPKKIRREKVRFGQAPRNSLPVGAEDASVESNVADAGTGAAIAPGAVMSSQGTASTETANLADNPLAPKAEAKSKTRFAAKSLEVKEKQQKLLTAKQVEKRAAAPTPMSSTEKVETATQSAPLGLEGDTAKKQKKAKQKRKRGDTKLRLEDKKKVEQPPETVVAPTASPSLAPTAATGTGLPGGATQTPASTPPTTPPASPPQQ